MATQEIRFAVETARSRRRGPCRFECAEVSSLLEGLYLKNAAGRVLRTTPAVPPLTAPSIVAILTSQQPTHGQSNEDDHVQVFAPPLATTNDYSNYEYSLLLRNFPTFCKRFLCSITDKKVFSVA